MRGLGQTEGQSEIGATQELQQSQADQAMQAVSGQEKGSGSSGSGSSGSGNSGSGNSGSGKSGGGNSGGGNTSPPRNRTYQNQVNRNSGQGDARQYQQDQRAQGIQPRPATAPANSAASLLSNPMIIGFGVLALLIVATKGK